MRDATRTERDVARLGWSLFPLRLFLGVTFVYGGIQKFSDPGFFHPGAPTYIGTQLRGFANGTPGGFLLRAFAIPHPSLAGAGVALTEIAVGLLITAGLLTRPAAVVGLLLNLVLFLTNSWHTYPYFLGSDIVFVFAWSPFVLVGATGQPSLEPALERIARRHRKDPRRRSGQPAPVPDAAVTRRRAIGTVLGAVGGATAAVAGVSLLLRGSYRPARTLSASATPHGHTPATATTSSAHHFKRVDHDQRVVDRRSSRGNWPAPRRGQARRRNPGPRRTGRHLLRSRRWAPRHRRAAVRRPTRGPQRGLHARRLHGRLSGRPDCLPLPRIEVRRTDRRGHHRTRGGPAGIAQGDPARRRDLRAARVIPGARAGSHPRKRHVPATVRPHLRRPRLARGRGKFVRIVPQNAPVVPSS